MTVTKLTPITSSLMPARTRPRRDPDWMLQQLPVTMAGEEFFGRFVRIFQTIGTTLFDDADNIDHVLDITVAPVEMVRWLASWIGMTSLDESLPEDLQRRIVSSAARTLAWRGTARGLRTYLELVTGTPVQVEEGGGIWEAGEAPVDTAWVKLHLDSTGTLGESELVAAVRDEVPAHVRAEVLVGGRVVWSTERAAESTPERRPEEGQ